MTGSVAQQVHNYQKTIIISISFDHSPILFQIRAEYLATDPGKRQGVFCNY